LPITDPVGSILEESGGSSRSLGQVLTPPTVVRAINAITLHDANGAQSTLTALDPCCGTGRFALDALVHHDNIFISNVDIDLWMVRAALINFRYTARFTVSRGENKVVVSGRARIIHADSLVVDLTCAENWRYSWMWNPPLWESTLKLAGFDGTYEEWRKSHPREESPRKTRSSARKS
jgi:predicted RNA methylase